MRNAAIFEAKILRGSVNLDKAMSNEDQKHRSHLPIPSPQRTGLITHNAKDPDTKFAPIEQLRPPKGA
jgi:hypothetical protein